MPSIESPTTRPEDLPAYTLALPRPEEGNTPTNDIAVSSEEEDYETACSDRSSVQEPTEHPITPTERVPTLKEMFESTSYKAICTFGDGLSSFYYTGNPSIPWTYLRTRVNEPNSIPAEVVARWKISTPHCVALGPLGAGYFSYTSSTDGETWCFLQAPLSRRPKKRKRKLYKYFNEVSGAHERLKEWLNENVFTADDIRSAKVAFGPGARFMAWKPEGTKWIGNKLPSGLMSELGTRMVQTKGASSMPRLVSFGAGESWAAVWKDGSHSIYLDSRYTVLSKKLEERLGDKIVHIALNPFGVDYHIRFGSVRQSSLIGSKPLLQSINDGWKCQALMWSRQLGESLYETSSGDGESSRRIVSPQTATNASIIQSLEEAKKAKKKENERVAEKVALLSIESSEKSIEASKIAVVGGMVAIAAACSVM